MAILTPSWMQNGTYPARYDRHVIQRAFGFREMVFDGLTVEQSAVPAASVLIRLGSCVINGDDMAGFTQGAYIVVVDADVTGFAMPAVPGANKRIDLISLRVNDPQAGGPAGNNATFVVTQGVVSATPVAPANPTSAIALVTVLRTAGDASILNAQITDVAGRGVWPYTVGTAAVPSKLPPNYAYIRVA